MKNQHAIRSYRALTILLGLLCLVASAGCGMGGTTNPTATTAPIPTPTVDLTHAREAFQSGGELTYEEVAALRQAIVGDPAKSDSIEDIDEYYQAQDEYLARESEFGRQLEKCKLKETVGWAIGWWHEHDADYKDIPDVNKLYVNMYDPYVD